MGNTTAFPVITPEKQKFFEELSKMRNKAPDIPEICGHYGRACRQMGKAEGANRALCFNCPLAESCKQ